MLLENKCDYIRENPKSNIFSFFYPTNVPAQTKCTCEDPPSILFGIKCPLPPIEEQDIQYNPRPLLALGYLWIEVLRRLLIPSSICGFGVTVVYAKKKEEPPPPVDCDPNRKLVRASDLPLYVEEKACEDCTPKKEETTPSLLVDTIKCAREELWLFLEQGRIASKQISQYYSEVREEADSALAFLREESNVAPRVGAIAIGGLTGLVLSLRKGLFKRLLYTTAGATTMAALCYPNEAKEYTEEGIKQGKKYILITYHFLNGVSRDLTGYQLPPLPSGHLVISDGHHHLDSTEVPPSAHLLPPTANATHIPMPHEERSEEMKKHQDQSHQENRDKTT